MTDRAGDQLVADYLGRLEAALASAPPDRRRELVEEIGAHVEAARAALPDGGDELAVRELLDRIGEPSEIAAAALAEDGSVPAPPAAAAPHGTADLPSTRPGWKEGLAVPLLLVGGFAVFIGWFAGVALLWSSTVWSYRDKMIGTLAVPFGWLPASAMMGGLISTGGSCYGYDDGRGNVVEQCSGGTGADPVFTIVFALLVLVPLATSVYLLVRLRTTRPAEPSRGGARSQPA